MTEAISKAVYDARREVAPVRRNDHHARLHVHIGERKATVMLLPGRFRDAAYVRRHVEFVLSRSVEQGQQHIQRNLSALRRNLEDMNVEQSEIDAEVERVSGAVWVELWRQVLTPVDQS
jgi:hypothetical protein